MDTGAHVDITPVSSVTDGGLQCAVVSGMEESVKNAVAAIKVKIATKTKQQKKQVAKKERTILAAIAEEQDAPSPYAIGDPKMFGASKCGHRTDAPTHAASNAAPVHQEQLETKPSSALERLQAQHRRGQTYRVLAEAKSAKVRQKVKAKVRD